MDSILEIILSSTETNSRLFLKIETESQSKYYPDLHAVCALLSGRLCPLFGHVEVTLDYGGQRGHVGALAHVPVLEQALLGHMGLLEVHAELEVAEHDLLDEFLAEVMVPLLGLDDIVKRVQSSGGLACKENNFRRIVFP